MLWRDLCLHGDEVHLNFSPVVYSSLYFLQVLRCAGVIGLIGQYSLSVSRLQLNRFIHRVCDQIVPKLVQTGLVKKALDGVKVLGNGELSKKLTVNVTAFSASAKEKIEKAGGKAEVM